MEADLDRVENDEYADTLRCITEDAKSKGPVHHVFQGATPRPGSATAGDGAGGQDAGSVACWARIYDGGRDLRLPVTARSRHTAI